MERCGIHSGRWKKVNRTPVKGTDFVDDTVSEGEQYQYRVVANNKMGPSSPSDPSQPIAAKPMRGELPQNTFLSLLYFHQASPFFFPSSFNNVYSSRF